MRRGEWVVLEAQCGVRVRAALRPSTNAPAHRRHADALKKEFVGVGNSEYTLG